MGGLVDEAATQDGDNLIDPVGELVAAIFDMDESIGVTDEAPR